MILYHGSNMYVKNIDLSKSRTNKDFGCGFYLSPDKAQAQAMAAFKSLTLGGNPCVSAFDFDEHIINCDLLKIKQFTEYSIDWAEFVLANRRNNSTSQIHDYDIVYGPIADDKVGPQIRRLENGDIDMDEFLRRIKYMRGITFQYFFGTLKAIRFLKSL